jgi:hypothetical protein
VTLTKDQDGLRKKPSVLFVYYTYTQQTLKVAEAMAGVLRGRGCGANLAATRVHRPSQRRQIQPVPMPHPSLERRRYVTIR